MRTRGRLEQDLLKVITYIKDRTSDGNYMPLNGYDVAALIGTNKTQGYQILSELKKRGEIEMEPRFGTRAYNYRYVQPSQRVEDEDRIVWFSKNKPVDQAAEAEIILTEGQEEQPITESVAVETLPMEYEVVAETQDDGPDLVLALDNFAGMITEFQQFLTQKLERVAVKDASAELEAKDLKIAQLEGQLAKAEEQLQIGRTAIDRCLVENSRFREDLSVKSDEVRELRRMADLDRKANDKIYNFMNERLEIAIAEITNATSSYVQMPAWTRNASVNAKYQKEVISAITTAVNDILNLTTTPDKEELVNER